MSDLINEIYIAIDACSLLYEGLAATFPSTGLPSRHMEGLGGVFSKQIIMVMTVFYFQGEFGPPGPSGLTGLTGVGIQGEKVGKMSSSMF